MRSENQLPLPIAALIIFFFGGFALWTGAGLADSCLDAWRLQDAEIVEASVLDIERVDVYAGDGMSEEVYVTYAYEFEGKRFEWRTRELSLFGDSSKILEQLESALSRGVTVPCYVSKSHPETSVFSTEFSILWFAVGALFPLAFGSIALLTIWAVIRGYQSKNKERMGKRS
ncbi:MAG: DUF3592 domain-containing protein [Planctomycetota bacterium]